MAKPCLFYLMGPSGAGKDSLIHFARQYFAEHASLVFAHRYITRPIDLNENHIALTESEFHARQHAGLFALHWQSHQLQYAIGNEINQWLENGCHILINGSRQYLDTAKQLYPDLIPILICVSADALAQRLRQRGRESEEQILERLKRAVVDIVDEDVFVIHNNSELHHAGEQLVQFLQQRMLESQ